MTECLGVASSGICRDQEDAETPFVTMENEGNLFMAAGKLAPFVEAKVLTLIIKNSQK
jgi:hypothetical protein